MSVIPGYMAAKGMMLSPWQQLMRSYIGPPPVQHVGPVPPPPPMNTHPDYMGKGINYNLAAQQSF